MELFARVLVIIGSLALSLAAISAIAGGHASTILSARYGAHVAGTLVMAAFWAACRFREWEPRTLQYIEAVALAGRYVNETILSTIAASIPWRDTPAAPLVSGLIQHYASTIVAMALTYVMILRAALVPSTAWRTAFLTAGVGFPVGVVTVFGAGVPVDADLTLRQLPRPPPRRCVH